MVRSRLGARSWLFEKLLRCGRGAKLLRFRVGENADEGEEVRELRKMSESTLVIIAEHRLEDYRGERQADWIDYRFMA